MHASNEETEGAAGLDPAADLGPAPPVDGRASREQLQAARADTRRWWFRLWFQPLLFLICGLLLLVAIGMAQRFGLLASNSESGHGHSSVAAGDSKYICPMMCTPPQSQPGRCPVCAMELVPATSGGGGDSRSIQVDPATRRVANIQTVAVTSHLTSRTIRSIGELRYDEGTRKTISAYVDGRLERLFADYTGVVVKKGDHLALVYSPRLYTGQAELLLAKKASDEGRTSALTGVGRSSKELYTSAKQRLIEQGMTPAQIEQLEQNGEANSRLYLCAPNGGTVIEKLAVEGQYVKEGDPIYQLADLSTVWLMLRLFPEDASAVRYGQKIEAEVQSLPGRKFEGRVAFIDPQVDASTRTVGVRVVIPNEEGVLRVGDYAKAVIDVPLHVGTDGMTYDAELANKWISPRHPHVISDSPGKCSVCGIELEPAEKFGFAAKPLTNTEALMVPRDAVLMAGANSVVYVETAPGRFEIRKVTLGPHCGDRVVIQSGIKEGEHVATRGNFLIDSQMQLAGNPSLIDPDKLIPQMEEGSKPELIAALAKMSKEDRELAERQRICPVADFALGSMGTPQKVEVKGQSVFICCEGCRENLLAEPDKYLAKLAAKKNETPSENRAVSVPEVPPIGDVEIIVPSESPAAADESKSAPAHAHSHDSAPKGVRR
jgi:membrane fusion protein, copper/silver efflux system